MNTISNNIRTLGIAFAAVLLLAVSFSFAPKAHADGFGDFGWIDYFPTDFGGGFDYYPDTYFDYYPDTNFSYYPDTYYDYYPDTYSYGSGYGSGYGFPMTYGSGFGGGFPFSYGGGGQGFTLTNVNQNQNQNTCTTGSCNTNINAPTTVSTISYPQPTYQQPTYYPTYQPTYQQPTYYPTYQQPNRTPYVSLSAVPYTGLDLGPWGTAAYWGFLVLWCLAAAYLIAVKKVHYKIANWFMGSAPVAPVATSSHSAPKVEVTETKVSTSGYSGIDPFIASQINRLSR